MDKVELKKVSFTPGVSNDQVESVGHTVGFIGFDSLINEHPRYRHRFGEVLGIIICGHGVEVIFKRGV